MRETAYQEVGSIRIEFSLPELNKMGSNPYS